MGLRCQWGNAMCMRSPVNCKAIKMFNSSSFGFVKVAYVADYGNFHIVPHSINGLARENVGHSQNGSHSPRPKQKRATFTMDNTPMAKPRKQGRMFLDVPY